MEILKDYSEGRENLRISSFFKAKKKYIRLYNSNLDFEKLTAKELESHWRDIVKKFIQDKSNANVISKNIRKILDAGRRINSFVS